MLRAQTVQATDQGHFDTVTLDYDDRYRRRVSLQTDGGVAVLLDLAETTELQAGNGLVLTDGRVLGVRAADEDLMEAVATDPRHLIRTAWHVGNRHLPCQIRENSLVLRWDHVIADMLRGLGCEVSRISAPFTPEGGAYGIGRTHGHAH